MIGPARTFAASDVSRIRAILSGVVKPSKAESKDGNGDKRKKLFYSERAASIEASLEKIANQIRARIASLSVYKGERE